MFPFRARDLQTGLQVGTALSCSVVDSGPISGAPIGLKTLSRSAYSSSDRKARLAESFEKMLPIVGLAKAKHAPDVDQPAPDRINRLAAELRAH